MHGHIWVTISQSVIIYVLTTGSAVIAVEADPRTFLGLENPTLEASSTTGGQSSVEHMQPATAVWNTPDIPITIQANTLQSENSVFVNPNNASQLLISNNSVDYPPFYRRGADYWVSSNSGQNWTGSVLGAGGRNWGDPAAAIGLSGRYFIGYIAEDFGQGVAYSSDGGASWTHVPVAFGTYDGNRSLDKNHLWVDNNLASPYPGYLYAGWTNFISYPFPPYEIEVARSTTLGSSWISRQVISTATNAVFLNQGVNLQTGPNGEVYAAWAVYDSDVLALFNESAIGFARSLDGGETFSPARRIRSDILGHRSIDLSDGKNMRHNSFPSMTVNQQTGRIYIVWTNIGRPGTNTGDPDIYLIWSDNRGDNWSQPIRVNQDKIGNGKDQWFPWISCDPVTGLLACVFYDSRNFPIILNQSRAETFVALSRDHGATWFDFLVSDSSWPGDGFYSTGAGPYAGDYIGVAARNNFIYPVWTDTRSGKLLAYVSPFHVGGSTLQVPSQAYPTIQSGIDAAVPWDTVLVSGGQYTGPGNVTLNFAGKDIVLKSSGGASQTRIECASANQGVVFNSGETRAAKLQGFTILNGQAVDGGGIYLGSSPHIDSCVFKTCWAGRGGAMFISGGLAPISPLITSCSFIGNVASPQGGAIYLAQYSMANISRCVFLKNEARNGGAVFVSADVGADDAINNCTFDSNYTSTNGGALQSGGALQLEGKTYLLCNTLVNNSSGGSRPAVVTIAPR